MNMSIGSSKFDGVPVRHPAPDGQARVVQRVVRAINRASGLGGLGIDELTTNLVQDARTRWPTSSGARGPHGRAPQVHGQRGVRSCRTDINVSPIFRYRSALPMHIWTGYDVNNDGVNNDIYTKAYQFAGIDAKGVTATYKEIGACTNINCGRGASQSVFNLRVSKVFALPRNMKLEAIAEIFNLFNAINPSFGVGAASAGRIFTGTAAAPVAERAPSWCRTATPATRATPSSASARSGSGSRSRPAHGSGLRAQGPAYRRNGPGDRSPGPFVCTVLPSPDLLIPDSRLLRNAGLRPAVTSP